MQPAFQQFADKLQFSLNLYVQTIRLGKTVYFHKVHQQLAVAIRVIVTAFLHALYHQAVFPTLLQVPPLAQPEAPAIAKHVLRSVSQCLLMKELVYW